jgi:hypothetical protein
VAAFSVAPGLHQDVERIPILIHRPLRIVVLAVHGGYDLVQVLCVTASRLSAPEGIGIGLPNLSVHCRIVSSLTITPEIGQDFLHIPEAQCKTEVQPHRVADVLGRVAVAGIGICFLFYRGYLADFSLPAS